MGERKKRTYKLIIEYFACQTSTSDWNNICQTNRLWQHHFKLNDEINSQRISFYEAEKKKIALFKLKNYKLLGCIKAIFWGIIIFSDYFKFHKKLYLEYYYHQIKESWKYIQKYK